MTALTPVVPDAKISADVTNQMLIVTASEEDHARIKSIVDEADRRAGRGTGDASLSARSGRTRRR